MAILASNTPFDNTSDALFRAWGLMISNFLSTGGHWAKSADTGQIDWGTVLAPGSTSTAMGYEIWESTDNSGGLNKMYLKIEYGSFSVSAASPAIWLTAGWATDGAGTITGTDKSTRVQIGSSGSGGIESYLSVGSGRMTALLANSNASYFFAFGIERTRDSAGAFQDELFITQGTWKMQVVTRGTAAWPQETNTLLMIPPKADPAASNSISVSPMFPQKVGLLPPSLNWCGVYSTSVAALKSIVNVRMDSVDRTYHIVGPAGILNWGGSSIYRPLMRYE